MNTLRIRLVSLLVFALLCVLVTYWFITLTRGAPVAASVTPPPAPPAVASAENLFGSADHGSQQFHVVGILALGPGQGAAAIIGSADGATRILAAGQSFDRDTRIAEVKSDSVIIEHGHQRSEVFLAKPAQSMGYVR
jgi:general secretion pathway protein C